MSTLNPISEDDKALEREILRLGIVKNLFVPVLSFVYTQSLKGMVEDADSWQYCEATITVQPLKSLAGTYLKLWKSPHVERKQQLTLQRFTWLGKQRGFCVSEITLDIEEMDGVDVAFSEPKKISLTEAAKISREKVCWIRERSGNRLVQPHIMIDNDSLNR